LRPKRAQAQWNAVGATRKDVQPSRMATLDFHRIKARDGLELPLWLTLPLTDGKPTTDATKRPRPAVVLVHGGPWVRGGSWHWNGEAQFLASRGYVVIEPEFRGSEGYGSRLYSAGIKQWGQTMQSDLADALQWAVQQGHVDARRVCIAGGSYGGYAALMGPVRDPGLYRCVAAWMAVTDLHQRLQAGVESDLSEEGRLYSLPQLMGDPKTDAAMLTDNSPLTHAAQIKVPVLLAVGAKDRRVPIVHGERMRDALRAAGNPPQWEVYPDEGHGWYKAESRTDFAIKLEAFLAQHLK
jgi:dipeptidyl aminopeptidase/acylaminoacyl peptidase